MICMRCEREIEGPWVPVFDWVEMEYPGGAGVLLGTLKQQQAVGGVHITCPALPCGEPLPTARHYRHPSGTIACGAQDESGDSALIEGGVFGCIQCQEIADMMRWEPKT